MFIYNINIFKWLVCAVFGLKNHCTRFKTLKRVPSAFLNLQNLVRPSIFHKDVLRETAVVIIKQLS